MQNYPIESLIDMYLSDKDIVKGSHELYQTILKQYINYLKENDISYATKEDIENFISWKKDLGYSTQWIYHLVSTIKGFYQYLSMNYTRLGIEEAYAIDITEDIKNIRIERQLTKPILSIAQAKHLILSTKQNRKYIWQYRDYAIIYLMLTSGLRSIEIRRAKIKDLSVINHELILYIQGKGRKDKDAYTKIPDGVRDAINDYLKKRKDKNSYLFISHSMHTDIPHLSRGFFNEMMKRVLHESGLSELKITAHSLRHSAAMFNMMRGASLEETKVLLRHQYLSSTFIYADHMNNQKELVENELENYIMGSDQHEEEV